MKGTALVAALVAAGCSTSTFNSRLDSDPLPKIAAGAAASGDWSITAQAPGTLTVEEPWPVHSIFIIGYTSMHVELSYRDQSLWTVAWLQTCGLFTLFVPEKFDVEDGLMGAMLKPRMREAVKRVLDWGEVPASERPPHLR